MVHYKLTYFDVRGYAEPSRMLLTLAGIPFEDIRYGNDDGKWEEDKNKFPFGQLPVLNIDGFEIPQSSSIARYLANKFGYAGKTLEEKAWADAIVDQMKDFVEQLYELVLAQRAKKPEEEIERIRKEVYIPAREAYFKIIKKRLESSASGYLVGDGLTWADLVVANNLYTLQHNGYYTPDDEPQIKQFYEMINATPVLKEYLDNRKHTDF